MTSAARPTWSAALGSGGGLRDGSSSAPTLQTCAKDQPGHLKLKLRQIGQDAPEEIKMKDYRGESTENGAAPRLLPNLISGDSDAEIDESDEEENRGSGSILQDISNETDSDIENSHESASGITNHSDQDEDDDDEEELMRELEKIKKEREAEKAAKEKKAAERDPHAILAGNPLLSTHSESEVSSFGVKRRWDEDVVFKNQAKGLDEKPQKRFINDTTRSDFHRRFMDRFIN